MGPVKQVILVRKDLNMPVGKIAAQVAHASLGAVWHIEEVFNETAQMPEAGKYMPWWLAYCQWREGTFTKVCLGVDSVEELDVYNRAAHYANLPYKLITDSGRTVFNGVLTVTCLAVGPYWADEIDKITGKLKLL